MSTGELRRAGLCVLGGLGTLWLFLAEPITARSAAQAGPACPAAHAKLDRHLHELVDNSAATNERVILRVRPGYQRRYREMLEHHGDRVLAEFTSIDALAVDLHGPDLHSLLLDPAVERISVDAPVRSAFDEGSGSGLSGLQGLRATLGLTGSWTGSGIGIAVIDSGLQPTADFETRVRAYYDFTGGGQSIPDDEFGHGTHVAGLAAGDGKLSKSSEFMGVAPKAHLVVLRVLDQMGAGYTSSVISAIDFAITKKATLGIDIVNLSLGHPIYEPAASDPLVLAVEKAVRAGIVVVVAAGNYGRSFGDDMTGYTGITSPGNAPSAITVGAFDTRATVSRTDDRIVPYSSRGPTWFDGYAKPDLVAPGHNLGSAAATSSWLYLTYPSLWVRSIGWDYMRLSGTSMAAAVTTGVIAHMLEASAATSGRRAPRLTPNVVKAILQYTSIQLRDDWDTPYDALTQGAGGINAAGAIELARAIRTSSSTGSYWLDKSLTPATPTSSVGGEIWFWGRTIIWGSTIATGQTVMLNHPAWATTVAWGSESANWASANTIVWGSGKTIVWGSNVVWDDPAMWASTIVWGSSLVGTVDPAAKTVVWGTTNVTSPTIVWGTLSPLSLSPAYDPGSLTLAR